MSAVNLQLRKTHLQKRPHRSEALRIVSPLLTQQDVGKFQIQGRRTQSRALPTLGCRCRVLSCNAC